MLPTRRGLAAPTLNLTGACNMTMHNDDIADEADALIEEGYAKMMTGFYRLRKAGLIQDEYDQMGVVIHMLLQDRQHIRKTYKVKI